MKHSQLPLKNINVIDFSQQLAGPAVAMILADLGANVIRVDPLDGPMWNNPANEVLNRNKSLLRLDLKNSADLDKALELIKGADVVLESFRPDVMKRLGIDFLELRKENPQLITLSMPGFASNDTLRRDWKATEAVVAATSGAFSDMGYNRILMGLNPSFSPLPLGSSYATTQAASAVIMALYSRERTGLGDHIEVPIVAALMEGLSYNSYVIENLPDRYKTMREHEITYRLDNSIPMDLSYTDLQEYLDPFYRTYKCSDDRYFYCVCPSHRNHAKRALKALGIYDELIAEGLPEVKDLHAPVSKWDGETSIGVYPLPKKWADIISKKMKAAFLTKTSEEWGVIFGKGQIPGAPHRTTQEWVNSEYSVESGLIIEVQDTKFGVMKQPGPIVWFEENAEALLSPSPAKDITYEDAMTSLFKNKSTLPSPVVVNDRSRGWLEGVKIVDLTNVIAGPHSSSFLTRFGAEVIRLDPIKPMYDPLIGTFFSFQTNMGKQSVLVDIMSIEGREIFNQLIKTADIVLINAPSRQVEPLGLDEESLHSINSNLIFCRLDCFGGPRGGTKTDYIGYDDIIQANSGIMSRFGGKDTPEEHAHLGTLDVNCGFAGGLSMITALYHRLRTGETSRPRTSLSAIANLVQIPFAYDYEGRGEFDEPSGRGALGYNALSHFYETSDSWLYLDSNESEFSKLSAILDFSSLSLNEDLSCKFKSIFASKPTSYWLDLFCEYDIAAAEPLTIEYLRENYSRDADGEVGTDLGSYAFSVYSNHPSGHVVTQVDHYAVRPTFASIKAVAPAEKYGHSTISVLQNLGYSLEDIEVLSERKIVGMGWSDQYLPGD
ncbi:CoA transferase [Photobacterium leiognathi]|uniref:CoA transferase n=1 Tax=Photobacterium leiognathi TaxID=553611 RepID=UPI002980C193|nr:CoA transferase [Photobacterium leiognathi]